MLTRSRSLLLLVAVMAIVVAACSGSGASPSVAAPETQAPASDAPTSEAPSSEAPSSEAPAAGGETVAVADSDHGQILVDGEGRTLYMFKPDSDGEPTCYDQCAGAWPPLTVDGEISVGAGLDAATSSTVERTDGSLQVKAGDWPLYYFANDAAPGDVNGQGVNDVWYVVSPAGEPIES